MELSELNWSYCPHKLFIISSHHLYSRSDKSLCQTGHDPAPIYKKGTSVGLGQMSNYKDMIYSSNYPFLVKNFIKSYNMLLPYATEINIGRGEWAKDGCPGRPKREINIF